MKLSKGLSAFAGVTVALILIRNGTLPKLIGDASRGAQDLSKGLVGLTRIA